MTAVTEQPSLAHMPSGSLAARIAETPAPADPKQAQAKLSDLIERAKATPEGAALLPFLENAFRSLLLAIADHSLFLWQLALADPARLARLAAQPPEELHRDFVRRVAGLYRTSP